ncbi:DEAD/DEAH box helicase [archaeon]|nr:MAG: DEAD/DEAH box helicase [archaeon]
MEEAALLSDELLLELGGSPDVIIAKKKTKKDATAKKVALPEEVEAKIKNLSKKQQKRVAQIEKRKVRESKRDEYMQTIASNVISDTQRQLLSKATSLGQTMSLKQTLSYLLRKEKAGLVLTEEERGLLYKQREVRDFDPSDFPLSFPAADMGDNLAKSAPQAPQAIHQLIADSPAESDALLSGEMEVGKASSVETVLGLQDSDDPMIVYSCDQSMQCDSGNANEQIVVPRLDLSAVHYRDGLRPLRTYLPHNIAAKRVVRRPLRQTARSSTDFTTPSCVEDIFHEETSKVRKRKAVDVEAIASSNSATLSPAEASKKKPSFGKSLLMQFAKLKEAADQKEQDNSGGIEEESGNAAWCDGVTLNDKAYQAQEIAEPVDVHGHVNIFSSSQEDHMGSAFQGAVDTSAYNRVSRPMDIQASRMQLPVCGMEQEIIEAVHEHDVIILCGETGSGKSTQIPQFLYEAGYTKRGLVGVTQPRRVAVTSTSDRVNYEMGQINNDSREGRLVGYQIRYDSSTVGKVTKIKFMTDGILLREITQDILLRQYSVIILDEAHERNVNTDILLGMLSRAVPLRKKISQEEYEVYNSLSEEEKDKYAKPLQPLKLIIMSATLRVTDFQCERLFQPIPPVIQVEARQYPVTVHFAKKTELRNYLQATYQKICQIHRKLPQGGILVFLTGKREIMYMCHKLQKTLNRQYRKSSASSTDAPNEAESGDAGKVLNVFESEDGVGAEGEEGNGVGADELTWSKNVDNVEEVDFSKYNDFHDDDMASIHTEVSNADIMQGSDSENDDENNSSQDSESDSDSEDVSDGKADASISNDDAAVPNEDAGAELRRQMLLQALNVSDHSDEDMDVDEKPEDSTGIEGNSGEAEPEQDEEEELPQLKPLIYPLYAMMPAALQARIFAEVPPGYRLIVVATNVAETSITIPNIAYVVDAGRQKTKVYKSSSSKSDDTTSTANMSISKFEIQWVSKASADQRAGRAGRTGPGHCYRLFSSNFYSEYMSDFQPPEILTTPLEDLVLQMKALGIKYIEQFPFPTMPSINRLQGAIKLLTYLGAMQSKSQAASDHSSYMKILYSVIGGSIGDTSHVLGLINQKESHEKLQGELTTIGKDMATYPIHPRLSKLLTMACRAVIAQSGDAMGMTILSHVLSLVSALAERSPFVRDDNHLRRKDMKSGDGKDKEESDEEADENEEEAQKKAAQNPLSEHPQGDSLARLRALGAFLFSAQQAGVDLIASHSGNRKAMKKVQEQVQVVELSKRYHLHIPTIQRVLDLRSQLQSISCKALQPYLSTGLDQLRSAINPSLSPPSTLEEMVLRQLLLTGYADCIARKAPVSVVQDMFKNKPEGQNLNRRKKYSAYLSCNPAITQPLYLHPQSTLYPADPTQVLPEFIVYHDLQYNTKGDTLYMLEASVIDMAWISAMTVDSTLLKFSSPLSSPAPIYDVAKDQIYAHTVPKFGQHNWKLPALQKPLRDIMNLAYEDSDGSTSGNSSVPLGYRKQDEEARWFARFLLEGHVVLGNYLKADYCVLSPSTITQSKMHPKVFPDIYHICYVC